MAQEVQNVALLYRLQWSNGKARKERYFSKLETAKSVYSLVVDALPNEDWCRLSEMEEDGVFGYVEKKTLLYSED